MKNLKFILLFSFLVLCFVKKISAQDSFVIKSYEASLSGTSNLHDWTATINSLSGTCNCTDTEITKISLAIDATTLESSKGKVMDNIMFDALKTDDYPKIYLKSSSFKLISENNGVSKYSGMGTMTIAGVSKTFSITSSHKNLQNGNFEVSGCVNILMTDYGIEPPTALFGTLTTANEVSISYKIIFQKSK